MKKSWSLKDFLRYLRTEEIKGKLGWEIQGIACNSRRVKDNYLFVAIPGLKNNGADFIEDAISRGAKAIITEQNLSAHFDQRRASFVKVPDAREALSKVSAAFYDFPSQKLKVIGITGTNGKTSTAYFLESILKTANLAVGVIGTVNYRLGERSIAAVHTTPESLNLHQLLQEMVEAGVTHLIMEVSSHALVQKRVSQIDFDIGIFTNFSQDHLDFHKTMRDYLNSKCLFFEYLGELSRKGDRKIGLFNGDDPVSEKILKKLENFPRVDTLSFGLGDKNLFQAKVIKADLSNNRFVIKNGSDYTEVDLALLGRHNIYNALAAAVCGASLGIDKKFIKEGLEKVRNIPGRFEFVGGNLPFKIIVDYAHTEDGLRNGLTTARAMNPKRIILVFGCGGNRDKLKRSLMGKAAEELADFSILTSDNPRSELPEDIIADIEAGFKLRTKYQVVLDRYQAIQSALKMAGPNDMIVVAGKGHETSQIFRDKVLAFDDREVARKILKEMGLVGTNEFFSK